MWPGQYGVNIPHSLYGVLYIRRHAQKHRAILYISLHFLGENTLETELIKPANPNTLKHGNTIFTEPLKFMCLQPVHKTRQKPCGETACEHAVRYLNSGAEHRCYFCVTSYESCIF